MLYTYTLYVSPKGKVFQLFWSKTGTDFDHSVLRLCIVSRLLPFWEEKRDISRVSWAAHSTKTKTFDVYPPPHPPPRDWTVDKDSNSIKGQSKKSDSLNFLDSHDNLNIFTLGEKVHYKGLKEYTRFDQFELVCHCSSVVRASKT